jgi:thymidylate kinase
VNCIVRVRLARLNGENLVCDRYGYDLLAQLYEEKVCTSVLHRLILKLFPSPSISFLFDVQEQTSWKRSITGERTFEQPLYNFTARRNIYLELAQQYEMNIIDSQLSPDEMIKEILRKFPPLLHNDATTAATPTVRLTG